MFMSFWSGKRKNLPVHILMAALLLKGVFVLWYSWPQYHRPNPDTSPAHQPAQVAGLEHVAVGSPLHQDC